MPRPELLFVRGVLLHHDILDEGLASAPSAVEKEQGTRGTVLIVGNMW